MKFFVVFVLLISCACCHSNYGQETPTDKLTMINQVRKNAAAKLRKDKQLYAIGTGAQAMDQIKMLALSFTYYNELTIEEGRELLIYAVSEFVNCVNEEGKIKPFLANVPFTPKNIEVMIFLKKADGSEIEGNKLHVITSIGGVLEYDIQDQSTDRLVTVHTETFAEGLERLSLGGQKAL